MSFYVLSTLGVGRGRSGESRSNICGLSLTHGLLLPYQEGAPSLSPFKLFFLSLFLKCGFCPFNSLC